MPVQSVQNAYSVSLKLLSYSLALCSSKLLSVFNINSHSKFSDFLLIGKEDAWTQFLYYNYMINQKKKTLINMFNHTLLFFTNMFRALL